jgi:hypothetical protein
VTTKIPSEIQFDAKYEAYVFSKFKTLGEAESVLRLGSFKKSAPFSTILLRTFRSSVLTVGGIGDGI